MSLVSLLKKKGRNTLFTTPSHSQRFFIYHKLRNLYKYDISETDTHNPQTALELAQKNAAKIYGTKSTSFLLNGSSSGIIAAVLACVNKDDNVLIWDNAHPCHKNAVRLAGANPIYYTISKNADWDIYEKTQPELIDSILKTSTIKAVIITSPSYEGVVSDIKAIKNLCTKYGVYLIVDEAHGALYPFSDNLPESAVKIADFTIQSLHKTAGGLNPTALLHCNCDIDVTEALSLITTTSPSYPMLASIEKNINYLNSKQGKKEIEKLIAEIKILQQTCSNIEFYGDDITKILIKSRKYTGFELSEQLFTKYHIEDERTNNKSTMLLCGIGTDEKKINRLKKALKKL